MFIPGFPAHCKDDVITAATAAATAAMSIHRNGERDRERQRERQRETQREGQTRDQTRPGSLSLSGASLLVTTCLRCCHKLLQYSVLRNVVDMTRVRPPANTVDVDNADTQALEEPRYRS